MAGPWCRDLPGGPVHAQHRQLHRCIGLGIADGAGGGGARRGRTDRPSRWLDAGLSAPLCSPPVCRPADPRPFSRGAGRGGGRFCRPVAVGAVAFRSTRQRLAADDGVGDHPVVVQRDPLLRVEPSQYVASAPAAREPRRVPAGFRPDHSWPGRRVAAGLRAFGLRRPDIGFGLNGQGGGASLRPHSRGERLGGRPRVGGDKRPRGGGRASRKHERPTTRRHGQTGHCGRVQP
jgi:hypothetical protein